MSRDFKSILNKLLVASLILAQITCLIPRSIAAIPPQNWDYHKGNWTYRDKLLLPIYIPTNYIPIDKNRTYVFNLNHQNRYHVYFYGNWIQPNGSKTDYDVFVYDPDGNLETYHTESAGLPEHLGTTVEEPFFTPKKDGNYSILILNDGRESDRADNGTLMVIEHLDVNKRYTNKLYMEGKDPITGKNRYYTSWAYEFNSSSKHLEIPIDVPDTLDMYEVRLYLMANPSLNPDSSLLGMPIAWEPGLYNRTNQGVGGYNINSTAYRGNSFDNCEYPGEDMLINYTSDYDGNLLYHLVFIAELGYGSPGFIIKTDFTKPYLNVSKPTQVLANTETLLNATSYDYESGVDSVKISYSTNDGLSWNILTMTKDQTQAYTAKIPGQPMGTTVLYKVEAQDYAENKASVNGTYQTKDPSSISITLSNSTIGGGQSINVSGSLVPEKEDTDILIQYVDPTGSATNRTLKTDSHGNFNDTYTPNMSGTWKILATWSGDQQYMGSSNTTNLSVEKIVPTITLTLSNNKGSYGESLVINGSLSPSFKDAIITLILTGPQGNTTVLKAKTSSLGTYSLNFEPNSKGSWTIIALFGGNSIYNSASTSLLSFEVSDSWSNFLFIIPIVPAIIVAIFIIRRVFRSSEYEY